MFPAWLGMPWGLGKNSTADRPHAPGMTVACGYFVAAVLENAGLALSSRYKYAQAPALQVQKALAPAAADLHRYFSVPSETLAAEIETFMKGSDYKQLDALTRALEDPQNRKAILAEPVLGLGRYQQTAVGIILNGGPKAIQLAIEQIGSAEAAASYKYINPTAPEGQRVEKPEAVRANTPGMNDERS